MKVYVIARPFIDWKAFNKFKIDEKAYWEYYHDGMAWSTVDAELLVELCGRLCYMSFKEGKQRDTRSYLENLKDKGHFSVFEHSNWTLFITGISRSLTHELIRHRHFSYSQLSQRYVDHSEFKMDAPKEIENHPRLKGLWDEVTNSIKLFYKEAVGGLKEETELKNKEIKTIARAILPNAVETKIAVTGNARAWRDFIETRSISEADPEIRELALLIRDTLIEQAPLLFQDLREEVNVTVL